MLSPKYRTLLGITFLFVESLCFCEESHIVICDDLSDIQKQLNDTTAWRYVQIGSTEYESDPVGQVLDTNIFFNLLRTKSLTIINRVRLIKTPFTLTELSQLEHLNLYANDIIEIDDYTFQNIPKVKELILQNNKIQHLGRSIFRNKSLEIVNLSRNRIRSITTCFYDSKIRWILLNHNKISYIKSGAFPRNLEQLELNHNLLENLEDGVFTNLLNLKELFLQHNRLVKIPNIAPLKKIQYLHFSYNNIEEVHYRFDEHPSLEFIDLASNSIRNVSGDAFATPSPPLVILTFNRLTSMKFNHPEKKTDLVLYGNPWNCDCVFQIEKIIKQYSHTSTCQVKFFDNGQVPLCIESGKCGTEDISNGDIDNFLGLVRVCEDEIRKYCSFRL